ncbi:alpha/beta hydrolase family protein [Pseudomonas kulmbachensis]|uniref:alpha/beta hydrolase family protein n=1 Tax=Pseudomonas kulmbachensis TaxID=3043408 RepID=UPI002AB0B8C4|nr:alpha/beta fold hydrolase [Pseudomonas sp. FLM 004-28]
MHKVIWMKRYRGWLISIVCLVMAIAFFVLSRLDTYGLDRRVSEPFSFEANGLLLAGTLWLPDQAAIAAVVLVHGDGPQDRTSQQGYDPLINALLDAGIAVVSWDKPGIGGSQGNWLSQSMTDRYVNARSAVSTLRSKLQGIPVGVLGFSQAGWVLPRLGPTEADFIVLVGGAVSWQRQGDYYTRTRLQRTGMSEPDVERVMAQMAAADERLFASSQVPPIALLGSMSPERWAFVRRNLHQDATHDLQELKVPVLALWGADDLNVNSEVNAEIYRKTAGGNHPANRIDVIPDATHGLLKTAPYNTQLTSEWPWFTTLRFLMESRHAYAPGALETITEWVHARAGVTEAR